MGRHSNDQAVESSYDPPRALRRMTVLLPLLLTLTLVAWGLLVYAAIDFGAEARSGDSTAWTLLAVTTVGAAVFLFVSLLLGIRIVSLRKGPPEPARPRGGRRAAR